jgi:acetyl esterase/lipase
MDQVSIMALPEGTNKNYYIFNPWIPHVSQVVLPPALITIGKLDKFYDRSVEFCRAMEAAGQDLEMVEYANMGHCFHLMSNFESCPEALDQSQKVVNFMNKRLQMLQAGSEADQVS